MAEGVEVYLRPSGDHVLLNMYVPKALAAEFIRALENGVFSDPAVPIGFEMSIQPQWYTEPGHAHVRVPLAAISLIQSE